MSTLTNLVFHVVFSTYERVPLIDKELQRVLFPFLGGKVRSQRGVLIEVGGMPDHVHCLLKIPPSQTVSDMVRAIKSSSSAWIKGLRPDQPFRWQVGYGAFTVSPSQVESVRRYIRNQEQHHRDRSFQTEYLGLLNKHGVEYDPRFLWR